MVSKALGKRSPLRRVAGSNPVCSAWVRVMESSLGTLIWCIINWRIDYAIQKQRKAAYDKALFHVIMEQGFFCKVLSWTNY